MIDDQDHCIHCTHTHTHTHTQIWVGYLSLLTSSIFSSKKSDESSIDRSVHACTSRIPLLYEYGYNHTVLRGYSRRIL